MDILYLFGFSTRTGTHLQRLLPIIKKQKEKGSNVGFVLIHDGVIGTIASSVIPKTLEELMNLGISVFAMAPDMKARGLSIDNLRSNIKPVEYSELVDILDETEKVISWM
ncbi:MAG: sulfurtransferase complex subunit TusB [Candidatus Hermodarchaeota archaeon]